MIYDLHSHSTASDGSLEPDALLVLAAECGVDALAITDHDTLSGFDRVDISVSRTRLIPGIEFSTTWRKYGVHIVGLNVDPACAALRGGVHRQQQSRHERARLIAQKLRSKGLPDMLDDVLQIAGGEPVGRPHFAEHLVRAGIVKDTRAAFRKYLGAGKPGDVRRCWASLPEVVGWIVGAGGTAVLAHPAKYGLTKTKLRALATDFRAAGGEAIEVVCGQQSANTTAHLARLANELDLAASCGSDFHHGDNAWSRPGRFPPLPQGVRPVWTTWQTYSR
ncbi:MAG TPA: PHP domain-containing protein [Woeseiaceae bacterium]|nr:PHP domain-containing protein [Woeseiaceae bacterium]